MAWGDIAGQSPLLPPGMAATRGQVLNADC